MLSKSREISLGRSETEEQRTDTGGESKDAPITDFVRNAAKEQQALQPISSVPHEVTISDMERREPPMEEGLSATSSEEEYPDEPPEGGGRGAKVRKMQMEKLVKKETKEAIEKAKREAIKEAIKEANEKAGGKAKKEAIEEAKKEAIKETEQGLLPPEWSW